MNITEYAENLFNLAYSQEMIDFITNLGDISSDEWRMKVTAIRGYYFFVFYKGQMFDILEHSIQTLININEEMYLCNTGISDKYNDNYFAWTKFGLIPVIRYSDIVFCGTTFISVDMLNEKQKELWDSVHSKLLEHNLLSGNRK